MRILYFARVRQIVGRGSEEAEIPDTVTTVSELMDYLSARDEGVAAAFAERRTIRAAIDQAHVQLDAPIAGAREIAFFPPVTGG
jgi:sulfur-carrier protein